MIRSSIGWIVFVIIIFVGCSGIPQQEYDDLQDELDRANEKIDELQNEIDILTDKITSVKAKSDIISGLFVPTITGEIEDFSSSQSVAMLLEWTEKIEESGDPVLKEKYQDLLNSGFDDDKLSIFFIYLFKSMSEDLQQ